jgi:hypothetical protein
LLGRGLDQLAATAATEPELDLATGLYRHAVGE